jgi:hypothetical protein
VTLHLEGWVLAAAVAVLLAYGGACYLAGVHEERRRAREEEERDDRENFRW